jgi:hypothetical protein
MERCLPVGRVGREGSSIRVLDHKKKTKRHKKENNQISTFRPFKAEINDRDRKMLTRGARRRKRRVNRSPGWQDMSKRVEKAKWGLESEKGKKRTE